MDTTSLLVVLSLILLGYLYLRRRKLYANLPPGPWSVPILGSLPFLGKDLRMEAMRMSKEFNSDLITISLGQQLCILLNSFDSIKAALSGEDFLDRPNIVFFLYLNKKGIGSANGQLWKEHRRLSLSVLRDMGMGKMAAEEKIEEEIHQLIDEIGKKGGRSFEIGPLLSMATANIILAILAGQRYDYEDPEVLYFVTRFKENLTLMPSESLLSIFPSLRHIPGDLFNYATIKKNVRAMQGFAVKHINEHKKRFDPDNIADFLDAYIAEKEKQDKKDPNNTFTDEQLKNVIFELFGAGSDTTATTLEWAILLMVTHPEIQRKIQSEIDDAIGDERFPTMKDRRSLPFTEAAVLEIQRFATILGFGLPHCNLFRDVSFQNFTIPKGTIMMPNIWAVHRDPKIWKNPDAFDPSNFLDDKGGVVHKPELIPFAIGRRQCPGEGLSKMEIFLVLVALLQRFTFTKPEGAAPPSLEGVFGVTNVPAPFEMCVRPRSTG
ncbi:cytochrome P450 2C15-like [Lineus longissimus]|uniref:cytochrome P450 2C15-like n=1 Tax=Lineus longissimus TaxID=88925 RepID=UPI00315CF6CC